MEFEQTTWHHAPEHRFLPGLTYMITGATLYKKHFYWTTAQLELLQSNLLNVTGRCSWELIVWAVFSNHYHFIARALDGAWPLARLIRRLHSKCGLALNSLDETPGRRVWYQYWDKCLTHPRSYYARLNYVIENPVHHGLVPVATAYPYGSAGWVERQWPSPVRRMLKSFKFDRIQEIDDFDPIWQR